MIAAVLLAVLGPSGITWAQGASGPAPPSRSTEAAVDTGAFRHLRALQDIASANGGNRAAGTPGYDRSAEYVSEQLANAGYRVRLEEFEFPFFQERSPPVLAVLLPDGSPVPASQAVRTLANSGSGDVTARLRPVNVELGAESPAASASGCEKGDFKDFERGAVALVRRGTCQFQTKAENAVAVGAVGVIIMNEGTDGRKDAFSGQLTKPVPVPVIGIPYTLGRTLGTQAQAHGITVHVAVDAVTGTRRSRNVIAEPSGGDGARIVVGAHLDSVPEGPGINDNGSGTAAVLEAALQLVLEPAQGRRHVRFAFWGAEERGLVGSRHHVDSLSEDERQRIALYINLDMVGSPNFARFVMGSAASGDGPDAMARRELLAGFRERNLNVEERTSSDERTSNAGRVGSDDFSFSQKGIPTVDLYAGAFGSKSQTQARLFGGVAGQPYDPCYHRPCDTIENIDRDVLEQNTQALVRALKVTAIDAQRLDRRSVH